MFGYMSFNNNYAPETTYISILISNKNDRICRDVKTQKVCEQGRDG